MNWVDRGGGVSTEGGQSGLPGSGELGYDKAVDRFCVRCSLTVRVGVRDCRRAIYREAELVYGSEGASTTYLKIQNNNI